MDIAVIGAGYGGICAALQAACMGARVRLIERADTLLGTGQVGGIFHNNARCTLEWECRHMGITEIWDFLERFRLHSGLDLPDNRHAVLVDAGAAAREIPRFLEKKGIEIYRRSRITRADKEGETIRRVADESGREFEADAFVDATGTAGPMSYCIREGGGCAMCVMRCPTFGGRVSPAVLAGASQQSTPYKMSGSCKLSPESLSTAVRRKLQKHGMVRLPLPQGLAQETLQNKACCQYASPVFAQNAVLLDTGFVKLMAPFIPIETLRQVAGLEQAEYVDPYAAGSNNSVRLCTRIEREDTLRVFPMHNLFCAGERAGLLVGHTEAILSGSLAGYNAVRSVQGKPLLKLPTSLVCGALLEQEECHRKVTTAAGGYFFAYLQDTGRYLTDEQAIALRVEKEGLSGIFAQSSCNLDTAEV